MGAYFDQLKRSMTWLADKPNTLFLGQAVGYPGTAQSNTLKDVPEGKKLELPVCEEMQMGMSTGLALAGYVPITIYPRFNFLLLATNQIVNHLDKIPLYSAYKPKVIIRVSVGSERPLHPQHQHVGDFTDAFQYHMCQSIDVINVFEADRIFKAYQKAYERDDGRSTMIVEYGDYYNEK